MAAFEFNRKVLAIISAMALPDKQEEMSLVMELNELFISFKIRYFTPECVSGTLNAT